MNETLYDNYDEWLLNLQDNPGDEYTTGQLAWEHQQKRIDALHKYIDGLEGKQGSPFEGYEEIKRLKELEHECRDFVMYTLKTHFIK